MVKVGPMLLVGIEGRHENETRVPKQAGFVEAQIHEGWVQILIFRIARIFWVDFWGSISLIFFRGVSTPIF